MKRYQFQLSTDLYNQIILPIRSKLDVIRLLVYSVKYILTEPHNNRGTSSHNKIVLYVNKMSRLFFCIENKIVSFQFPFFVNESEETPELLDITFAPFMQIDSVNSSLLIALFNQPDIFDGDLDTILTRVLEEMNENEWPVSDINQFLELIKHLMLFEPGYLRYDHDEDNQNGSFHPEHHIDFYYSSNNTFKLGLKKEAQPEWLVDMVDTLSECKYIY
jgi:hypothetical protein